MAFFNDKLIFNIDIHSHMQYLEHVLEVVDQNQLKLNKKKCMFGPHVLEYQKKGSQMILRR